MKGIFKPTVDDVTVPLHPRAPLTRSVTCGTGPVPGHAHESQKLRPTPHTADCAAAPRELLSNKNTIATRRNIL
ncbi:MAG: hypothetical protein IJU81_02785 [Bacteroidales bacterium]|nr:hypothetical protein [Bacteroidales bacterium]